MSDLFFLAFDHRDSFAREVLGGDPDPAQEAQVAEVKSLVFDGLAAVEVTGGRPCLLIDEHYSGAIPSRARKLDIPFAVAVERSGRALFEFEYGERFADHIELLDPDFAKVLVRYNPAGERGDNEVQAERLKRLGDYLASAGRPFLFELLVPATPAQLERAGSKEAFEREQRPALIESAMRELQERGIEPDLWKLEGVDEGADASQIAARAAATPRGGEVACVVLGAGAEDDRVDHWLRVAAATDGWRGFAIGRSIWRQPVRDYLAGDLDADGVGAEVAARFARFADVYCGK